MKFCMVTSFFGNHSFGGDSVYIERLCQAILRQGYEVHVAYFPGAHRSVSRGTSLRCYESPEGIVLHPLSTPGLKGAANAAWAQMTGKPGPLFRSLEKIFRLNCFDVIHLHNISLMGAETVLRLACSASRMATVMTMHDYWWVCPQSLFWKFRRQQCDYPQCFQCNIRRGVPPQLWRDEQRMREALNCLDALFYPSHSAAEIYRQHRVEHSETHILPGILPREWGFFETEEEEESTFSSGERPYIAAAGRLVVEKGFQILIPLMERFPEFDLFVAGDGLLRKDLEELASGLDNVKFTGLLSSREVRRLFKGARVVVIPSLFPETFGLVAAEAISLGVPVIARATGALPEVIGSAGAGELFYDQKGLEEKLERVRVEGQGFDPNFFRPDPPDVWFEDAHLQLYLSIILDRCGGNRKGGSR